MKRLRVSPTVSFPLDIATQTGAIIARKRRGKTYTASVIFEECVKAGIPAVAIDPTGAWYGLRSSADGKKPGLAVTIIGGEHGDVPLEVGAGKVIADLIVDNPGHYVLDVSDFDPEDMHRLAADFGERLFKRKKKARFPLLVFNDEADMTVPQVPESKEHHRALRAFDKMVRRGGLYGLGVILITQRPALVNKNVLSQVEFLIALQLIGAQDRDAVERWVKTHDTGNKAAEFMQSLASLGLGEAWVWSPSWLGIFERTQIRQRETFNSSKTPEVGDKIVAPKVLAEVDLVAIREKVAATIAKAKREDPAALQRRIAELESAAARQPQAVAKPEVRTERVEVPVVLAPHLSRVEKLIARVEAIAAKEVDLRSEMLTELKGLVVQLNKGIPAAIPNSSRLSTMAAYPRTAQAAMPPARFQEPVKAIPAPLPAVKVEAAGRELYQGERAILSALASRDGTPLHRREVAVLAVMSPTGGTFKTYLGNLKRFQFAREDSMGAVLVTPQGYDAICPVPGARVPKVDPDALIEAWQGKLYDGERRLFKAVLDHRLTNAPLSREELANMASMTKDGGTFKTYIGNLKRYGIVEETRDGVVLGPLYI